MSDSVYPTGLLRLAAAQTGAGGAEAGDLTLEESNPLCGDTCRVHLRLKSGRIERLRYEVRACILVQASAEALAQGAEGADLHAVQRLQSEVRGMLAGGPVPTEPFSAYGALASAAPIARRHSCVLLPLIATERALASIEAI